MSSSNPLYRDPLWYCHECHAEMRPLMVPDPHCASCNSDFVEKLESPADDPREFAEPAAQDPSGFLGLLGQLLAPPGGAGGGMRLELRSGPGGAARTIVFGGPPTLGPHTGFGADPFAALHGDGAPQARRTDTPMLGNYLMALLGAHPAFMGAGGHGGRPGQWGDYVLDQEELDRIVTQLMEAGNVNRPVPAPEMLVDSLPRRTLPPGAFFDASPDARAKECAVCKDTLIPAPDEGVQPTETELLTLPCLHEFHEECITPWLKNSGTCPVCRHQLIPQPDQHAAPGGDPAPAARASGLVPPPASATTSHLPVRRGPAPATGHRPPAPTASVSAQTAPYPVYTTYPARDSARDREQDRERQRSQERERDWARVRRSRPPSSTRSPNRSSARSPTRTAASAAAAAAEARRAGSRPTSPAPYPPGAWDDVD